MRFRKQTTFNSHDTEYERAGNRIVIKNGMKKRCELALNGILRSPKGMNVKMLTESLNKRLGAKYSETDLHTALHRLVEEGLVRVKDGIYRATANALPNWNKTVKVVK